ncbi:hypothetical protein [Oceanidesulfovibrio marinus]|uniref:Uncharacterized protein n=1 Tax=Oceanidesulfovibrio marinus TaxID=370038 RepID=A0A6P1ZB88_9BACT|nr:hypothetical protein [Oceanidesulfovibrio marinus]TVM31175.1 hypothetical protein DQK91_18875 [Oceanidesulfovibrio marinus]
MILSALSGITSTLGVRGSIFAAIALVLGITAGAQYFRAEWLANDVTTLESKVTALEGTIKVRDTQLHVAGEAAEGFKEQFETCEETHREYIEKYQRVVSKLRSAETRKPASGEVLAPEDAKILEGEVNAIMGF